MSLPAGGLVALIAVIYSLFTAAPRNRPFSEPPSDAVDHVNP